MLKAAIAVLLLGLLVFMGMALLNTEAQRTQIALLQEDIAKLQGAKGAGAGPTAGGPRVATFDATTPALFDDATAAAPQLIPVQPLSGSGNEIQLAVVTLVGVEGTGGVVPLSSPAVVVQKGVSQEVRGGCSVDAAPTAGWVFALEGSSLQVSSHECAGTRGGLKPQLKVTVFQ